MQILFSRILCGVSTRMVPKWVLASSTCGLRSRTISRISASEARFTAYRRKSGAERRYGGKACLRGTRLPSRAAGRIRAGREPRATSRQLRLPESQMRSSLRAKSTRPPFSSIVPSAPVHPPVAGNDAVADKPVDGHVFYDQAPPSRRPPITAQVLGKAISANLRRSRSM